MLSQKIQSYLQSSLSAKGRRLASIWLAQPKSVSGHILSVLAWKPAQDPSTSTSSWNLSNASSASAFSSLLCGMSCLDRMPLLISSALMRLRVTGTFITVAGNFLTFRKLVKCNKAYYYYYYNYYYYYWTWVAERHWYNLQHQLHLGAQISGNDFWSSHYNNTIMETFCTSTWVTCPWHSWMVVGKHNR